jgi:hypothetical protein
VLDIARKGLHSPEEWKGWLARATALPTGPALFRSSAGLARRHDALAFLQTLYVALQESQEPALRERLLPPVRAALAALP